MFDERDYTEETSVQIQARKHRETLEILKKVGIAIVVVCVLAGLLWLSVKESRKEAALAEQARLADTSPATVGTIFIQIKKGVEAEVSEVIQSAVRALGERSVGLWAQPLYVVHVPGQTLTVRQVQEGSGTTLEGDLSKVPLKQVVCAEGLQVTAPTDDPRMPGLITMGTQALLEANSSRNGIALKGTFHIVQGDGHKGVAAIKTSCGYTLTADWFDQVSDHVLPAIKAAK